MNESIATKLRRVAALARSGDAIGALELIEEIEKLGPERAAEFDLMGAICSLCGEQDLAQQYFLRAVNLEPENPGFLHNLSTTQRFLGDFVAAEQTCNRVIEANPCDYRAYYVRADLRRQTADNNHVEELKALLVAGIPEWRGEVCIRYALAKEYEDLGAYSDSFAMVAKAAALQRAHMRYDVEEDINVIDAVISSHTREWLAQTGLGFPSDEPILVLGLPRSGTTLVERIVGAHSDVYAAGELNNFASALIKTASAATDGKNLTRSELVAASCKLDFLSLGRTYIDSTRPQTGHTPKFVDKMPQNFLYCGLIAASLPNAKILCLSRHPMDACYSMYKVMFTGAYPFSYDLLELGRYYLAFRRLLEHWKSVLDDRLLIVEYETLVRNFPEEVCKIVEFCGLDWEEACLEFHRSGAPTSTASAVQVRRPVYTSSIGRWRHFEKELSPLMQYFKNEGLSLD